MGFPTQGSNPGLLRFGQSLYHLSRQESKHRCRFDSEGRETHQVSPSPCSLYPGTIPQPRFSALGTKRSTTVPPSASGSDQSLGQPEKECADRDTAGEGAAEPGAPEVCAGLPGPTRPCPKVWLCQPRAGLSKVCQRAAGKG